MRNKVDLLHNDLRNWLNGLSTKTMSELFEIEGQWQIELLNLYSDGILTKIEINERWEDWEMMKLSEIAYLDA